MEYNLHADIPIFYALIEPTEGFVNYIVVVKIKTVSVVNLYFGRFTRIAVY